MLEDYKNALKSGQRAYRACVARGQSPYLAVLDDILVNVNIVSQEPLGLVEIPAESIVGTKTSGRHTAFAANFMPLLEPDTEFAAKWSNLCEAHLEEGIHTPIIAFEFMTGSMCRRATSGSRCSSITARSRSRARSPG